MARPKKSPEQQLRASQLYGSFSASAITRQLEREYDTPVSQRTVERWVQGFKDPGTEVPGLDSPFEWHRMGEYQKEGWGLPWEASSYILTLWSFAIETEAKRFIGVQLPPPTVREILWAWRVHLAAPDVDAPDVWDLAQRFVYRELLREVSGQPLYIDDLEAHLAYRPWESDDRLELYRRAVNEGRIPALRKETLKGPNWQALIQRRGSDPGGLPPSLLRQLPSISIGKNAELLPSQQVRLLIEEFKEERHDERDNKEARQE